VCDVGRVFGRALRPCYGVPWAGQLDALQPTVEHAGDGPGAIHRRGADAVDELADVMPGELVLPQLVLQRLPGVLVLVPPAGSLPSWPRRPDCKQGPPAAICTPNWTAGKHDPSLGR
jgi:hypothetical protein